MKSLGKNSKRLSDTFRRHLQTRKCKSYRPSSKGQTWCTDMRRSLITSTSMEDIMWIQIWRRWSFFAKALIVNCLDGWIWYNLTATTCYWIKLSHRKMPWRGPKPRGKERLTPCPIMRSFASFTWYRRLHQTSSKHYSRADEQSSPRINLKTFSISLTPNVRPHSLPDLHLHLWAVGVVVSNVVTQNILLGNAPVNRARRNNQIRS
jgi:hypothetical protein